MALELRSTGYGSGRDLQRSAYQVVDREKVIGRIHRSNAESMWLWTLYTPRESEQAGGTAHSFDEAYADFKQAWSRHCSTHRRPR